MRDGDQLPGTSTLAEKLVVSPNVVVKVYSELEDERLVELRQGSGAFLTMKSGARSRTNDAYEARRRGGELIQVLREDGLREEEFRRVSETDLLHVAQA